VVVRMTVGLALTAIALAIAGRRMRWLKRLAPLGYGVNSVLEVTFILAQIAVIMAFAVIVVYSKHLHIALAPLNVMFSRRPNALGPLEPMRSGGKVLDFEKADPDTDVFGLGTIEDFTWKGLPAARTASTPSPASTRSWAGTTR
jgi:hypothetical protein